MAQNTPEKHAADAVNLKIHLQLAVNTTKHIFTKMLAQ